MVLKAALVQFFVELKLEHIPIPLGYADPFMAVRSLLRLSRSRPSGSRELILFIKGDLWGFLFRWDPHLLNHLITSVIQENFVYFRESAHTQV